MIRKCPLCKQPLPPAVDPKTLERRQQKLVNEALERETKKIRREEREELRVEFRRKEAGIERKAQREAERKYKRRMEGAEKKGAKSAERRAEAEIKKSEAKRMQERRRHEGHVSQLQRKFDDLSRKLEKQSSERRGEEGEVDLLALLKAEFPNDRMERIGRGVKGADIVQHVKDGDKKVGCIIYECKNVSAWQNAFVTKAKAYRAKYTTPYVLIVTRAFPRNKRNLCVVKGVPVVDFHLSPVLARLIRESLIEMANLKTTQENRGVRASELWEYMLSDEFQTKFKEIADSAEELRGLQVKERDWHDNHWTKQSKLHEQIRSREKQIESRVKGITRKRVRLAKASA